MIKENYVYFFTSCLFDVTSSSRSLVCTSLDKPGQVQDQKDQIYSMQTSNQEKGPILFQKIVRYCATQMID